MRIVIISRCIFPSIAPRPFRATELAKYFAKQGHDVTLIASLGKYDYSSFESNTGIRVLSLGPMLFSTMNSDDYFRNTIFDRIARRLLGRAFEFPDIELMWRVKKSITQLTNVDLLITIAIPYPIHWGAALARKKRPSLFPRIWISDCGDPYMGNSVGKKHPFYFRYLENFWGEMTDYITIPIEASRCAYSEAVQDKIRVIPQGFDFSNVELDSNYQEGDVIRFAYAGATYPGYRDPTKLLDYLVKLKNKEFEFTIYTKAKELFNNYKALLGDKLVLKSYIPREKLLYELSQMDFLINLTNGSAVQSPSKLIDYYLTHRPIIDVSSSFTERDVFDEFMNRNFIHKHINVDISQYDINNVGKQFIDLAQ